jgi:alpha-N-arabinofuranosidase
MKTTLAILALAAAAHAQAPAARIKIDTDRRIGEISPLVFGNFAEHLGRMIYGGIYEEGSPLSDKEGFRTDVMAAVKNMGVSILRYPGGNFASGYNWKDGVGPKDQRPVRPELAWNDIETNRFGTDEFVQYCRRIGAEPFICINAGLGTIDQAREWVEYTNEERHTYWADQRRKNGHDAPWKVTYWGLGNEIDGPWQLGHKNAEEYARFALEAAKAMRSVDRSIKLIASGSSNYGAGADWAGWNRTVVNTLRDQIDYISLHTYIGNQQNDLERFLGESQATIERYIDTTAAIIREARGGRPNARPIYIAYDEWNVWYRAQNDKHLEEVYNFEDALAMGMFFNTFFRHADVVKMANLAQMVNVIAPMMTNKQGMFLQPTYFPVAEYSKQRGNIALNSFVSAPANLDVSTTYNPGTRTLFVNVLNRSKSQDIPTRIESQEGALAKSGEVWQMNNGDLKATHTFGDDKKVVPTVKALTAQFERNALTYTFPAHSLTILKLKVE